MTLRRAMILGASPGSIGAIVRERLKYTLQFEEVTSYGLEDFDVMQRIVFRSVIKEDRPTDVVYCVGVNKLDWIKDINPLDFSEVLGANVYGFLNMIRLLDEAEIGPVNVVAITSDAAWRPMRTSALYCASKAALEMAVRVASREYAPKGWRVNAVAPGKVEDTNMTRYVDQRVLDLRGWTVEAAEAYELQSTPLGRKVTKDEVAQAVESVVFGPDAMTGEIIAVNGGR